MSDVNTNGELRSGTAQGLLEFIDWAGKRSLINPNTAGGYRAAAKAVLSVEDDLSALNVREIDVDALLARFTNAQSAEYRPGSLTTYKTRFAKAVQMYLDWLDNPEGFKPVARSRSKSTPSRRSNLKPAEESQPPMEDDDASELVPKTGTSRLLTYPFPLKSGEVAYLQLPPRVSSDDAERLSKFVGSIALDDSIDPPAAEGQ
jgi:hypothetical protein